MRTRLIPLCCTLVVLVSCSAAPESARTASDPIPVDPARFDGDWVGDIGFRVNPSRATDDYQEIRDEQLRRTWYLELRTYLGETVVRVRTVARRDRNHTLPSDLEALPTSDVSTSEGALEFVLADSPDGDICRLEGELERGEIVATILCEHRPAGMGTLWTSLGRARFQPAEGM